MKKFLKLCATFTLIGALFVGCIDNTEPDGVLVMRQAKAELLKAQASLLKAKEAVEAAKAAFINAAADYVKALTRFKDAQTALKEQEVKKAELENEYTKLVQLARSEYEIADLNNKIAKLKADQELAIAKNNVEIEAQLTLLEVQRKLTLEATYSYLERSIALYKSLDDYKATELDRISGQIYILLTEKAERENQLATQQAKKLMYMNVEIPKIQAVLAYELEIAQFAYNIAEHYYEMWTELKDLTIDQYEAYLPKMQEELTEAYARSITLRLEVDADKYDLAKLKNDRDFAELEYKYGGGQYNISIDNVFSQVANDIFRLGFNVEQGYTTSTPTPTVIFTGVVNNTYSFYKEVGADALFGAKATLGAKNAMENLIKDSIYIEQNRIIRGLEGELQASDLLAAKLDAKTKAENAFTTACNDWRTAYKYVTTASEYSWDTQWTNWDAAKTRHDGWYGKIYTDGYSDDDIQDRALQLILKVGELNKDGITDPAQREAAVKGIVGTVNLQYLVQQRLISTYVKNVKAALFGTGEFDYLGDWQGLELNKFVQVSDVLGGITVNPGGVLSIFWGGKNVDAFEKLVNAIVGYSLTFGIVDAIAELMPIYYASAFQFQYGVPTDYSLYGLGWILQPPNMSEEYIANWALNHPAIMMKYGVDAPWEYHIWFLLYILFESSPLTISDVIVINAEGYDNATTKLFKDFLGYKTTNFPGYYSDNTTAPTVADPPAAIATTAFQTARIEGSFFKAPAAVAVADLEQALYTKYIAFGTNLRNLNSKDLALYGAYNSVWGSNYATATTSGHQWTAKYGAKTLSRTDATKAKDFYFQPELNNMHVSGSYPSLDEDVDLYWTRGWVPYEYINFANIYPSVDWWYAYYPSIAVHRVALTGTQYNTWINIGNPLYNHDPVLWEAKSEAILKNWASLESGKDALLNTTVTAENVPSLVANAFIARRNYNQHKFWYDENTEYDSYGKLLAQIGEEIANLRPIVEELYGNWVDAQQAVVFKEFEIKAKENQANLYEQNYFTMLAAVGNLTYDAVTKTWVFPYYEGAFRIWNEAKAVLAAAEQNIVAFETLGVYHDGFIFNNSSYATFQANRVLEIDAKIAALEDRLKVIDIELALVEAERDQILATVYNL